MPVTDIDMGKCHISLKRGSQQVEVVMSPLNDCQEDIHYLLHLLELQ